MMKTFWKRTLVVWLAAVLLVASAPAAGIAGMANFLSVTAAAETVSGDCGAVGSNVTWNLDTEAGVLTISGTGTMADYAYNSSPWVSYRSSVKAVTIDSGVKTIGKYAFDGCTGLTSVTIPDSVTSIGWGAFEGCTSLTSVTIPDSVTTIGDYAFRGCTGLTSVTIPGNVTSIGLCAFENCTSLTSATIGDSVTSIGSYAFYRCTGLTCVTIPDSVTTIGTSAFSGCTSLTSVTIPDSVTGIGGSAFSGCTGISTFAVSVGNTCYTNDEAGVLYNKDKTVLVAYPCGNPRSSFSIPNSVTGIGSYAFDGCTGLTSVTIPDSVTTIGDYAFYGCTGLTSVSIPDSVTTIGDYAFRGCTGLTSVTIPDSVTSVGYSAFYGVGSIVYSGSATGSPWGATHGYRQVITQPTCTEGGFTTYTCSVCGDSYTTDETPALGHTWDDSVVTPPTCTEGGFTTYTCSRCGDRYTADETPALGHCFTNYVYDDNATCTENGTKTASCDRGCGVTDTVTDEGTAFGHDYDIIVTPPTCTEGGFATYTCSVCGDSYTADETPALGHVFDEWTVVEEPSFTSEGLEKHVCTRCGLEETRPIGVLPPDGPTAAAADAVVGCSAGRLVKVTIDMYNNPGIIAARLHVGYDPQQLRLVNVENGTVFDASTFQPGGRLTDVPFTVLWSDDLAHDDVTADGTLVTLTFAVQPTATVGETTVTVTSDAASTLNAALQRMPLATADGTVSIVDCAPGDISGDGELGLLDTVMLSRYLAGGWGVSVNEINADVNGDAVLDLRDVVLIRRFLAGGWDVTLI